VFVSALVHPTAPRFGDIRWPRWWAVLYSVLSLSAFGFLYRYPDTNLGFVILAAIVLQGPVAFNEEPVEVR
jgi:hypothetical protein